MHQPQENIWVIVVVEVATPIAEVVVNIGTTGTTTETVENVIRTPAATMIAKTVIVTETATAIVITTEEITVTGEIAAAPRPLVVVVVGTLPTIVGAEAIPGVLLVVAAQHAAVATTMVLRTQVLAAVLNLAGPPKGPSLLLCFDFLDTVTPRRSCW